jgi:hypothetical protein
MNNVSDSFRDGLRRFGLQFDGLPLERKDGKLVLHVVQGKLPADQYPPEDHHLKLAGFHANGSATTRELPLTFDAVGKPDTVALSAAWLVDQAEMAVMTRRREARKLVSDQALSSAPTPEAKRKLRLLRDLLDPPRPINLGRATGDQAFLSNAAWTDARVG